MKGFVRAGWGRYCSADISRADWWVAASIKGGSQSNLSCYLGDEKDGWRRRLIG